MQRAQRGGVLSNRRVQPAGPASRAHSARSYTTKTRGVEPHTGPSIALLTRCVRQIEEGADVVDEASAARELVRRPLSTRRCVRVIGLLQESKRAEVLQEQEQKRLASAPPHGQGDQVSSPCALHRAGLIPGGLVPCRSLI